MSLASPKHASIPPGALPFTLILDGSPIADDIFPHDGVVSVEDELVGHMVYSEAKYRDPLRSYLATTSVQVSVHGTVVSSTPTMLIWVHPSQQQAGTTHGSESDT